MFNNKDGPPGGMTSMLAGMFGIDPARLMQSVEDVQGAITGAAEAMQRIEANQIIIMHALVKMGAIKQEDMQADGSGSGNAAGGGDDSAPYRFPNRAIGVD